MRNCRPLMVTLTWAICHLLFIRIEHVADGCYRGVDARAGPAIGGLGVARARRRVIEFARQPGAVAVERMDPVSERLRRAIGLAAALRRGIERLKRE